MAQNVDVTKFVEDYLGQSDWRVKENSNVQHSFSGLLLHSAGSVVARYALSLYPKKVSDAHQNGEIHIHDLSMGIAGYCAGWSLKQLLYEGFNGVQGKVSSKPPKHLASALGQMVNFLGTLQNEWAGAMAFSSFDTYLAPFIRHDNLDYETVRQLVQQFVFNMNVSSRWGGQTPFSNITLDWIVPEDMKDQKVIIGGELQEETYADFQKEMDMINKAFIEVMIAGDSTGRIFTFPIPTYNITKDFDWDSENAHLLFEMTAKYGIPYFQNFINSDLKPSDVRSMCCRLQMDLRQLRSRTGGLFGSGESTGSIGVVTINLPRIGYESKTEDAFLKRVGELMDIAYESLEFKRKLVNGFLDEGLFPYTKRYLGTLNNHFSTIGLNGMNEAIQNLFGKEENIATTKGRAFALTVLDYMRERITTYQEESGNIYNLEATPAEGTAYRFARIDRQKYPDIIAAGEKVPYYTNSSQLPVGYTDDMFEALDLQDELQSKYTGGTVFHTFIGEQISDIDVCKRLVKKIATNYHLPYFTITPTFSICPEHGYLSGEHVTCPTCHESCDVYSRVVGYFRPVSQWNEGKSQEYDHRVEFKVAAKEKQKNIDAWGQELAKCFLVTSKSCPNCSITKKFLEGQDKIPCEVIDASTPEGLQRAQQYGVSSVPTAVFCSDKDDVVTKINGSQQIQSYVNSL